MKKVFFYFLYLFFRILSRTSKRFKKLLSSGTAFFLFSVLKQWRQRAVTNYQKAFPEKSLQEVEEELKICYRNLCLSIIEYLDVYRLHTQPDYFSIEIRGEHYLKKAIDKKKGVLLLTGHFGNLELAGGFLSCVRNYPIGAIVRQQSSSFVERAFDHVRKSIKATIFKATQSIFSVLKFLKSQGIVMIFFDQVSRSGKKVVFFNREAYAMSGLEVLAKRSQAPVIPLFFYRENDKHILEFFEEVPFDGKMQNMTQVYTTILEGFIRKCPEQWIWIYNRWRQ